MFTQTLDLTMRKRFSALLFLTSVAGAEAWVQAPKMKSSRRAPLMASDVYDAESRMTIVGSGRIGGLLAEGGDSIIVGRNDLIDENGSGPILVTTRNDALGGIVDACPQNRRKDLVFMQNGYLDDFLQSKGLMDNTQVLLFLSVTQKGAPAIDGVTKMNPEGLTAATGEHAQAFANRLTALNLKCKVITPQEYRPAMFEKLM